MSAKKKVAHVRIPAVGQNHAAMFDKNESYILVCVTVATLLLSTRTVDIKRNGTNCETATHLG